MVMGEGCGDTEGCLWYNRSLLILYWVKNKYGTQYRIEAMLTFGVMWDHMRFQGGLYSTGQFYGLQIRFTGYKSDLFVV